MPQEIITIKKRECGTCSTCCDGWLDGSAYGHAFYPGRPCHFLAEKKCVIYGKHPKDPCQNFQCHWLENPEIPGWLRPKESGVIITFSKVDGIEYLNLIEAGEKLRSEVLSWAVMYCLKGGINLRYQLSGGYNKIGSQKFLDSKI